MPGKPRWPPSSATRVDLRLAARSRHERARQIEITEANITPLVRGKPLLPFASNRTLY
ncbi:MAG: hypothetical protein ACUVXB_04430 [Bryobacteraceae bacterium]